MMYGIDISSWQGDIDLSPFSDHFVIIRCGYGYSTADQYFARNVEKCKKLNIPFGVYFFSEAIDVETAEKEADFVIKLLEPYKKDIKVGVWYDLESSPWKSNHGYKMSHDCISPIAFTFCKKVEAEGYYTGIYCSQSWLQYLAPENDRFDKWVANWGRNDGQKTTDTSSLGTIQQFTSNYQGRSLDGNIMFADISRYSKVKITDTEKAKANATVTDGMIQYIMTVNQWFYAVIGKGFNVDGKYGCQCWDLFAWFLIKFGISLCTRCKLSTYVEDLWYLRNEYGYEKYFEFITDSKKLQNGDWIVWGKGSSCPLSHIGMYYNGKILGQNQQKDSMLTCLKSVKLDMLGAFRLKGWVVASADPVVPASEIDTADLVDLLYRTMKNEFGTGNDRKVALGNRYAEVQEKINHIYSADVATLASEVWTGDYGNGTVREVILGNRYQSVQNAVNGKSNQYYKVRSDDTLTEIAEKFGTTVDQLVLWNNIKDRNFIYVNQKLRVS